MFIARWSRRHKWVFARPWFRRKQAARVRAPEDLALKDEASAWAKKLLALRMERYNEGDSMILKSREMIRFPVSRSRTKGGLTIIEPGKWNFSDMARMAETGLKLEALALGVPTDGHKTVHTGSDGAPTAISSNAIVIVLPHNGRDLEPRPTE